MPLPDDIAAFVADRDRLAVLAEYDVLDTPPEADFDDIVLVAATACTVPIALISFLDRDRQWVKAHHGHEVG